MIASFDNKKHDIQLNGISYRIRGYQRSDFNPFIPRLGSGEQSQSEFDLLRSSSVGTFEGGSLQRIWSDEFSLYGIEGLFPKYGDGVLYPTNGIEEETSKFTSGSYDDKTSVVAYCRTQDYLFVAVTDSDLLTYNSSKIYRVSKSGTVTTLTTSFATNGQYVTDMVIHNNRLWIATTASTAMYYCELDSTTVTAITGGSGWVTKMVVYRGELYGTAGAYKNNILYRYTGTLVTRDFEQVGDTGKEEYDDTAKLFLYNNRIILTRTDGLYGYDGIIMNTIEDQTSNESLQNYRYPAVLKGYLYYFMPDGMFRFNGSLIEKIYDISEIGFPSGMEQGGGYLWITFNNSQYEGSSRYDKSMGYDYSTSLTKSGRLMQFDGNGMYTYGRFPTYEYDALKGDSYQGDTSIPMYFNGTVFIGTLFSYDEITYKTKDEPTTASWRVVTSIFDGEFPQIKKHFEEIELVFDGTVVDENLTVEYRIGNFDTGSGWATYGTLSTATGVLNVLDSLDGELEFTKIQFRISGTTTLTYGIEKIILRYILMPDYKNQWTFTVLCYGDDSYAKLQLQDSTEDTQDVYLLRGNIYESRESDKPVGFIDVDYLQLGTAVNSTDTTLILPSTTILKSDEGFVQIGSEIMKVTSRVSNALSVERGALGSTAISHSSGATIYPYYRVILRQIQNERIELTDDEGFTTNRNRNSEITLVLQEV